ncbi:InlB B-repeat-containing protein [Oryzibacter oryziterrae]|uniref:InlB B-repeat-containing protein n=1 Tax=Oryzibacter oryziterrae TaxID=2766474 RepID=UPI001F1BB997|nr:M12 family metallo-peptidase [Oryzibacter oryziterrae]
MKRVFACLALLSGVLLADHVVAQPQKMLGGGVPVTMGALPTSRLKNDLAVLPPAIQTKALRKLSTFAFPVMDGKFLRVDKQGAPFYEDPMATKAAPFDLKRLKREKLGSPTVDQSVIEVNSGDTFKLHSRPGAPNVVYLNFVGGVVTGTQWNVASGIASNTMLTYSEDNDHSTFSQAERNTIAEVWKLIAEDYAPFNIDVTTEPPAAFTSVVGNVMFTPQVDAAGNSVYSCQCGGVAYVGVWGQSDYASRYQPAFVFSRYGFAPDYVLDAKVLAEAGAHEFGHNQGLAHDGTASVGYYEGHGTGNLSWAPIMGASYYSNVTQWSKGEYFDANNGQDDLAIIANNLGYATDDHVDVASGATALVSDAATGAVSSNTNVSSPDTPSDKTNRGTIGKTGDIDVFTFTADTSGTVDLTITPEWLDSFQTESLRGSNLKVRATLYNAATGDGGAPVFGSVVATATQSDDSFAHLSTNVAAGTYYLAIDGVGFGVLHDTGFSSYNSMGRYYINGSVPAQPSTFTLSVAKSGTGSGSVESDLSGISCGETCSFAFSSGSSVTLTATADANSTFEEWTGDCTGTGACTLTMDQPHSVSATFTTLPNYTLTVAKAGSGSGTVTSDPSGISCGSTCSADYMQGTEVTLAAVATSGSVFSGWSGGCSGTGACVVTLDSAKAVTATFTPVPSYALTVSKTGSGSGTVNSAPSGISCGATCSASYSSGTSVTLTATALSGSTFSGWSGACSGTSTCVVSMTAAKSVSAAFTRTNLSFALAVTKTGTGTGTVTSTPSGISCGASCSKSFASGTSVSLTASAAAGSDFAGWSGAGCSGTGTCTVSMTASKSVMARFNHRPKITVVRGGNGAGKVKSSPAGINCGSTCSATFASTAKIALTATADNGSVFLYWSGACSGTNPVCTLASGTANKSARAVFGIGGGKLLTVKKSGNGTGAVVSAPEAISCGTACAARFVTNASVTLTATASASSKFTGWSGACSGNSKTCRIKMSAARTVTAIFAKASTAHLASN